MKKIVLDIQSDIHAHTMERMLMQKLDDCQVVISESPDATAEWCKTHRPDVLLIDFESESAQDITYTFTVENEKLLLVSTEKDKEITYELTKTNDG